MIYDVIIIGGGVAGVTAAIYLKMAGLNIAIIEKELIGGKLNYISRVYNFPGYLSIEGENLAKNISKQLENLHIETICSEATDVEYINNFFQVYTTGNVYISKYLIIAVGSEPKKIEKIKASYCEICEGHLYKGKSVAVIGGGDSAFSCALYLSNIASKVYLIHRRDEFRGSDSLVDKVKSKDNIELVLNSTIIELLGDGKLQSIKLDDGRTIEIDGLFVSIGRMPNAATFCTGLALADGDYVSASDDCKTNIDGLFVAGDVRAKEIRQLVTATADGAIAAAG